MSAINNIIHLPKKPTQPSTNATKTPAATAHRGGAETAANTPKLPLKDLLKLPNVDKRMVEVILDEIVEQKNVKFNDIGERTIKKAFYIHTQ